MAGPAEDVHFPEEEEGMSGIHIDLHKHEGFSGGDPGFSGGFHGAGSGGAEPVDPHKGEADKSSEQFDMDKATGHRSGPGSAGAHPVIRQGPVAASQSATSSGGVGAGRGPTGPDGQPHPHQHQA